MSIKEVLKSPLLFDESLPPPDKKQKAMRFQDVVTQHARFDGYPLRLLMKALGEDWLPPVQKILITATIVESCSGHYMTMKLA